jgi:hypothetical protein
VRHHRRGQRRHDQSHAARRPIAKTAQILSDDDIEQIGREMMALRKIDRI